MYYYRGLPYDPVRPWKDLDGKWYSTISTDGCNSTTKKVPCALGGQLDLWVSDALHGPKANWKHTGAMFTSPKDVLPGVKEEREFVTSGYCKLVILSRFAALSVSLTPKASLLQSAQSPATRPAAPRASSPTAAAPTPGRPSSTSACRATAASSYWAPSRAPSA